MAKTIVELKLDKIYKGGDLKSRLHVMTFRCYGENLDEVIKEFEHKGRYLFTVDGYDLLVKDIDNDDEE